VHRSPRLLAIAGALTAGLTASAPAAAPNPAPPKPAPRQTVLYRPVGCASRAGAVAIRQGPPRKVVALTFDDGPWPDTPAFVSMLEANHVPATFFLIGRQVTGTYQATLLRELRDGDVLGDHTFDHPDLTRVGDVTGQLQHTLARIRAVSGYTPCVFRPPDGSYDGSVLRIAASLHLATIIWSVDPSDYLQPGVGAIEQRVLAQVGRGAIVISHDGGGPRQQTLEAYPHIIAALRARGYSFVTVPQLLGFHTVYHRCVKLCDGIGVRALLPRGSIVQ
jgi:peptidoglycan/xylan/chitin deacetylase (PgdA/CDA1 family)